MFLSSIICILIFLLFSLNTVSIEMKLDNYNENESYNLQNVESVNSLSENYFVTNTNKENSTVINKTTKENLKSNWKIEIPKISLIAEIAEGTTEEILNEYVGHFEETQKEKGNIGLAAHNRGYKVNYFNRIRELEIDDEIYYTYNELSRKYKVISKSIIKDTDWSFLENTSDNRLTLITCVEDKPEYRRCIQAVESFN